MDFILTMESRDKPKELQFERRSDIVKRMKAQNAATSRANVLTGKAKQALKDRVSFKLPEAYATKGVLNRRTPTQRPARTKRPIAPSNKA